MSDPFMSAMGTAASAMGAQGTRIRVVAENVANAETPGYRRKQLTFEEVADGEARRVRSIACSRTTRRSNVCTTPATRSPMPQAMSNFPTSTR
jgi:flagellar basal-body rod protein FlgB